MTSCKATVRAYFDAWLTKDASVLARVFSPRVHYSESWGPVYRGLAQVERWFEDWNAQGTVLAWDIHEFVCDSGRAVCRWYFKCDYAGEITGFDGVSWMTFDENGAITSVKEYQSSLPHVYPYDSDKGEDTP